MAKRDAPPPPFSERAQPLILALFALAILLIALEFFQPGYFLHDDNATWFAGAYLHDWRVLMETGRFAVINYYQYGGEPFLAQGQTGVLYPPVYVGELLSRVTSGGGHWAIEWIVAMHLLFALAGFYFWLRENRVPRKLAALAGLAWVLQPFVLIVGANWVVAIYAGAWMPWVFWAFSWMLARPSLPSAAILGTATGLFFLQGYAQWVAYTLLFLGMYAACLIVLRPELRTFQMARLLGFTALVFLFWSTPLLLPMLHATGISAARSGPVNLEKMFFYHVESQLLWPAQIGLFRPFMFGVSSVIFFCPVLLLWPLALAHFFKAEPDVRKLLVVFMLLALLAVILSGQGYYLLSWVPLLDRFRWPFKIFLLAEFFAFSALLVLLASWSFGRWREQQRLAAKVGMVFLIIAGASISLWQHDANLFSKTGLPVRPPILPPGLDPNLGRVIAIDDRLPEETSASFFTHAYGTYYQVPSIGGYNPLVSRTTLDFGFGIDFPNVYNLSANHEITPQIRDAWASRGVRYWIIDPHAANLPDFARIGTLQLIALEPDRIIYEDQRAQGIVHSMAKPEESCPLVYAGNALLVSLAKATSPVHVSVGPGKGWWYRLDQGAWKKAEYKHDGLVIDFPAGTKKLQVSYFDPIFKEGLWLSGFLLVVIFVLVVGQRRFDPAEVLE